MMSTHTRILMFVAQFVESRLASCVEVTHYLGPHVTSGATETPPCPLPCSYPPPPGTQCV